MEALLFYVLAAIILASAFLVVFLRRPIHNVVFMIITMIGLAGLFIMLRAEFVAMVQLIVYAGAVMVLFLFVVMLLNLDRILLPDDWKDTRAWVGIGFAFVLFLLLIPVFNRFVGGSSVILPSDNTRSIATELFTTYLLPFEIASILLLAAMIGTIVLARKRGDGPRFRPNRPAERNDQ